MSRPRPGGAAAEGDAHRRLSDQEFMARVALAAIQKMLATATGVRRYGPAARAALIKTHGVRVEQTRSGDTFEVTVTVY